MSSCLGDWEAGSGVRFELAYVRLSEQDAERSEHLARVCRLRSARGLPPLASRFPGVPMSFIGAVAAWTDPSVCAFCHKPLNVAGKAGRENRTGVCRGCHDTIGGERRAMVMAAVAERRKEIAP